MDVLPACISVHHVFAVPVDGRRGSELLGLESQLAVGHHKKAGN